MRPEIYGYYRYRRYLKDLTVWLKAEKKFNLRDFARRAGIKAPGYLKMVIDGKRNLTEDMVQKFCQALDITGRQKIYFEKLVAYEQTKNPDLKRAYYEDLASLRPRSPSYQLGKQQSLYFSQPHYVVIREMVALKDFKEDYKWIAKRCFPSIKPSEAKEAIETLLELGLLKRDGKGKLVQVEDFVRTQDKNTEVVEAYHFHEAVLDRARYALGMLDQKERSYYALTLPLTEELYDEIISEFYAFRDQVIEKIEKNKKGLDDVYQMNFQLFPVTKKKGGSK